MNRLLLAVVVALSGCGDDGDDNNADAAVADAPAAGACATYCDNVMANCTGDNAVYAERAECEAACAAMPEGSSDDMSGNTAYCRAYHAGAAASDPSTHCPHSSISSDGDICGTACEAYCDQVMANCTGDNAVHADRAACETACAGYATGTWNDTGADSVQCRAYHASFPAAGDPGLHCPHTADDGGGVCVAQ